MNIIQPPWSLKFSHILFIVVIILSTPGASTSAVAAETFGEQVLTITQQCSDDMSNEQLLQTISKIDTLSKKIQQSQHLKKKWFIIRLKKSRNLCDYLIQLSMTKADNRVLE